METTAALVLVVFTIEHVLGVDTDAEISPRAGTEVFVLSIAENFVPLTPFSVMRPIFVVTMRVVIVAGLDTPSRGFTRVKLRSTGVAGANFASPDWVATTVQRTGSGAIALRKACAKESSRCPKTSQVLEVADLKVTGRPEEAVAFNGTVGPNSRLGIGGKLID